MPLKPKEAKYSEGESGVSVEWTVNSAGSTPVLGYVIEGLDDGKSCW